MIAEPYILHWRDSFPWAKMHNVEQDLLISRAVVAIYSDKFLASLALHGAGALRCISSISSRRLAIART